MRDVRGMGGRHDTYHLRIVKARVDLFVGAHREVTRKHRTGGGTAEDARKAAGVEEGGEVAGGRVSSQARAWRRVWAYTCEWGRRPDQT